MSASPAGTSQQRSEFGTLLNDLTAAAIDMLPGQHDAYAATRASVMRAFDAVCAERDALAAKLTEVGQHIDVAGKAIERVRPFVVRMNDPRIEAWKAYPKDARHTVHLYLDSWPHGLGESARLAADALQALGGGEP